jgi:AAA15 family ATPase/GTPase
MLVLKFLPEGGQSAMLLQFTVGNFKSFKEKVTLSLEATTDDWREEDNIAHVASPDLRLVKTAAIYGPNAGGKSNFIDAMAQFRSLVLGSSKDSQKGEPIAVTPFRLHIATEKAATFFEVLFLRDGIRYRYGFEATKEAIVSEWLYKQAESIRPTCLFTRENSNIAPGDSFKEGKGLEERTRPNALFLSVVAQFNGSIAGEVVSWIGQFRVITGLYDAGYMPFTAELLSNEEYGASICELVRQADVGIEDLIREDIDKDQLSERLSKDRKDLPQALRDLIMQNAPGASIVRTVHQRFDSDNRVVGKVEFDLATEESDGTQQFFALAGPFLHTLNEGSVLVVDELDARLHPLLTRQLVGLFNSSANRKNAQLIFATHDQGLLDQKRIRRDQIWFVEKDAMGASNLFCLDEIKGVRKDANFEKEYLLGQFGGVPHIGDFQKALVHAEE